MSPLVHLILAMVPPGLAAAETRVVAPGDYLAAAVAAARPGDELILSAGSTPAPSPSIARARCAARPALSSTGETRVAS